MFEKLFTRPAPSSVSHLAPQIVPSAYGGASLIAPSRPEPVYVPPVQWTADQVVQFMGFTSAEQIDEAAAFGFPAPVAYQHKRHGGGVNRTAVYSADKVREWRERVKHLAGL